MKKKWKRKTLFSIAEIELTENKIEKHIVARLFAVGWWGGSPSGKKWTSPSFFAPPPHLTLVPIFGQELGPQLRFLKINEMNKLHKFWQHVSL